MIPSTALDSARCYLDRPCLAEGVGSPPKELEESTLLLPERVNVGMALAVP